VLGKRLELVCGRNLEGFGNVGWRSLECCTQSLTVVSGEGSEDQCTDINVDSKDRLTSLLPSNLPFHKWCGLESPKCLNHVSRYQMSGIFSLMKGKV
jgi:hypothetical protein